MLDIEIIEQIIEELENGDTTFFNCNNLASLYIVRENLRQSKLDKELFDIIPTYRKYCETKKKYQFHEVTESAVDLDLQKVCNEIYEFIKELYSSTESKTEREIIDDLITKLYVNPRG